MSKWPLAFIFLEFLKTLFELDLVKENKYMIANKACPAKISSWI